MRPRMDLRWASLAIVATVTGLFPVGVLAQTTASCLSDFNWMFNTKDQSPCVVASYLQGECDPTQAAMPPLPALTHYTGPYANQQNPCECSSVVYTTVSACGLCQNRTIVSWTTWSANCSTVYPGVYPPGVPNTTSIPQWAFQDVTTSNTFNLTLALSVGDNPESTASHPLSTGSPSTTSASATSLTATPSATSGSQSNVGPITGGVIGGVAGVALIAGVVAFFVVRQKRSRIPPSAQFTSGQAISGASSGYPDTTPFASQMAQPRLYDPSDPSTFPASPPPTTVRTGSSYDGSGGAYYTNPPMQTGAAHYSGAPEI